MLALAVPIAVVLLPDVRGIELLEGVAACSSLVDDVTPVAVTGAEDVG